MTKEELDVLRSLKDSIRSLATHVKDLVDEINNNEKVNSLSIEIEQLREAIKELTESKLS